ncbi:MAG: hypothetical protein E7Z81_10090 [Methanobrevibacter sp.]|uniref:hypothetical protein n=1 Tax=Methanobrevibacter sp. TaxID=66852 RepID=UPI0025CF7982|nr:hypothetical protein [Methanobrevibacter sp.]MBE6498601.1 hypothetical protein [Methanobrevibacter sp.]
MAEKIDFHIKADKSKTVKARELSGLTNREIFELGCKAAIEQHQNVLDTEILELNEAMDKVNELTASVRSRLRDMEVPTKPSDDSDSDSEDMIRNHIPLELFKEMVLYYMDTFGITDIQELSSKNKEVFRFFLINLAYHDMNMDDVNKLYEDMNSE